MPGSPRKRSSRVLKPGSGDTPAAVRRAGWCYECKEALADCVCGLDEPVDFQTRRAAWCVQDDGNDD